MWLNLAIPALAVIVIVQGLALLELVRQFAQVRERLSLDNKATAHPAQVGLTVDLRELFTTYNHHLRRPYCAVLLLSDKCATCMDIASQWNRVGEVSLEQADLIPVLDTRSQARYEKFMRDSRFGEQTVVPDLEGEISEKLSRMVGVRARPSVVILNEGQVYRIDIVRNVTQLLEVLQSLPVHAGANGVNR
ncbi:MAG: hypothetical protein L0H63_09575 [Nitrococcus sp.]|nr:hypothetical protein [Nitrococcus sp.]